jgi:hypothetical protein
MATITHAFQRTRVGCDISLGGSLNPGAPGLGMANSAHKMYFLCKTNPMSSNAKMSLNAYRKKDYEPIGHLVQWDKQTQFSTCPPLPRVAQTLSLSKAPHLAPGFTRGLHVNALCCPPNSTPSPSHVLQMIKSFCNIFAPSCLCRVNIVQNCILLT